MILFPNAKVNIGLRILNRRPDGYHNIESIFIPVGWQDVLEIVPGSGPRTTLTQSGPMAVECPVEKNLVMKALRILENEIGYELPPTDIYLRKNIPSGAGLGGGSSDAAFALKGLNEVHALGLKPEHLARIAAKVGADCPFFIFNRPMLVRGIGDVMEPLELPCIEGKTILIAKRSGTGVSTAEAYASVRPEELPVGVSLRDAVRNLHSPLLVNDFEEALFPTRCDIASLKAVIESSGAVYTSMSGSGASVFGIFDDVKMAENVRATLSGSDTYVGPIPFHG